MEIGIGGIVLIGTALIFALLLHLTSVTRVERIIGHFGCGGAVLAALVGFPLVGFGLLIAGLMVSAAIRAFTKSARSW